MSSIMMDRASRAFGWENPEVFVRSAGGAFAPSDRHHQCAARLCRYRAVHPLLFARIDESARPGVTLALEEPVAIHPRAQRMCLEVESRPARIEIDCTHGLSTAILQSLASCCSTTRLFHSETSASPKPSSSNRFDVMPFFPIRVHEYNAVVAVTNEPNQPLADEFEKTGLPSAILIRPFGPRCREFLDVSRMVDRYIRSAHRRSILHCRACLLPELEPALHHPPAGYRQKKLLCSRRRSCRTCGNLCKGTARVFAMMSSSRSLP